MRYRYNSNYFAFLVFSIAVFLHIELFYVENAPDVLPFFYTCVYFELLRIFISLKKDI